MVLGRVAAVHQRNQIVDSIVHGDRLGVQFRGGAGGLFRLGGGVLDVLVNLRDRGIDLFDTAGLLLRGARHVGGEIADFGGGAADLLEGGRDPAANLSAAVGARDRYFDALT